MHPATLPTNSTKRVLGCSCVTHTSLRTWGECEGARVFFDDNSNFKKRSNLQTSGQFYHPIIWKEGKSSLSHNLGCDVCGLRLCIDFSLSLSPMFSSWLCQPSFIQPLSCSPITSLFPLFSEKSDCFLRHTHYTGFRHSPSIHKQVNVMAV